LKMVKIPCHDTFYSFKVYFYIELNVPKVEAKNEIQITRKSFKAKLEVIIFKDPSGSFVGYAPSIDVSSYGDTQDEALNATREAIEIYFNYTRNKGTLEQDLKRMGWKKEIMKHSSLVAPDLDTISHDNPLLINIMNSPDNYLQKSISIPA